MAYERTRPTRIRSDQEVDRGAVWRPGRGRMMITSSHECSRSAAYNRVGPITGESVPLFTEVKR
jgi:hypothetical protein